MAEQDPLKFGVSNRTRTPGTTPQDRQRIAGRLGSNSISRNQAAQGTAGATTGDSSGTGANTSGGGTINFGGSSRLGSTGNSSTNRNANSFLSNLNRQARRGAISVRSAAKIAAGVLGDQISSEDNRLNIASREGIEARSLGQQAVDAEAGRALSRDNTRDTLASQERVSNNRLLSDEADRATRVEEGRLDRASRETLGAASNKIASDRLAQNQSQFEETSRVQADQFERSFQLELDEVDRNIEAATTEAERNEAIFRRDTLIDLAGVDYGLVPEGPRGGLERLFQDTLRGPATPSQAAESLGQVAPTESQIEELRAIASGSTKASPAAQMSARRKLAELVN